MKIHSVYWIHLAEHTDIFTQGYIGVSCRSVKKRLNEHKTYSQNPHLANAFEKYENIIVSVLLIGSKEYCYEIEEKLRLTDAIGWNISKGGICPPNTKKGRKVSEERKAKISRTLTGRKLPVRSEEHKKNISKGLTGIKLSEQHKLNISKGKRGRKHQKKRSYSKNILKVFNS